RVLLSVPARPVPRLHARNDHRRAPGWRLRRVCGDPCELRVDQRSGRGTRGYRLHRGAVRQRRARRHRRGCARPLRRDSRRGAARRAVRLRGDAFLFVPAEVGPVTLERYSEDIIFGGIALRGIIGRKIYGTWAKTRELLARAEVRSKIRAVITDTLPIARYEE